jgi:chromosome segregation ATPase
MTEEVIKTPVGKTKTQIWDAYKVLRDKHLASEEGQATTTTAVAQQKKANQAVAAASSVNITGLSDSVQKLMDDISNAKTIYDDLQTAIETKKSELQEVHGIEAEANTLVVLVETKDQLVSQKEEQARALVTEATERAQALLEAAKDKDAQMAENRKREEEEWSYRFGRSKKEAEDTLQDTLDQRVKAIEEREGEVEEREAKVTEYETTVQDLEDSIARTEAAVEQRIEEAVTSAAAKAKTSANIQLAMEKKTFEAEASIKAARIETLEERVAELLGQLADQQDLVSEANNKLSEMAKASLQAGADAQTVAKITEVAAGANKK